MTDPIHPNPAPPPYTPPPQPFAPQPDAPHPDAGAYVPPPTGGGYPPDAYPWAAPPPPASHTRRNAVIAAVVVVVLVAAGLGAYLGFRGSGSSGRLALPGSFDGFSHEQDAAASRVEGLFRGMGAGPGGEGKQFFDAATFGLYQNDADVTSKLMVFAVRTGKMPHNVGTGSPSNITSELLQYMGSAVAERRSGPHGGSSRCGVTSVGAVQETVCGWSDSATTGMLVMLVSAGNPVTPDRLSAIELALRDQID
jgi:hypothetical protein